MNFYSEAKNNNMSNNELTLQQTYDLRDGKVFHKLTPEEQQEILYKRSCKSIRRNTILYRENSRITGTYLLHSGIVKMFKTGIDGKEQIVRFAQKGHLVGYRSVLSEELACTTAQVIKNAEISFIPESVLKKLVMQNSRFSMGLMRMACQELGEANSYIMNIAQKTVRERLAEILLILKRDFGTAEDGHLNINLTREELANLIGTATESVIRLLSEFKSDGSITLTGRKIKVLDENELKRMANTF